MKHFLILIVCVATLTGFAAPAAAQDNGTVGVDDLPEDLVDDSCEAPEPIDERTVICSADLQDGTAVLVLRSDTPQRVTLTDGAGQLTSGPVNRNTYQLRADEENTVRFGVTEYRGIASVSVDTGRVLYGVPLAEPSTLIGGPWTAQDSQLAAGAAGAATALMSIFVVFRTLLGRTEKPERVA